LIAAFWGLRHRFGTFTAKPMDKIFAEIKERVQKAYRSDEIWLLDRGIVAEAKIEPVDAEFLCSVGVPIIKQLEITFNLADKLPALREYLGHGYRSNWPDLRCLNAHEDFIYGVCNGRDGCVICLDLSGRYHDDIFINSKVRYMIGFLAECRLCWTRCDQEQIPKNQSFQLARNWMNNVDPEGFKTGYWQAVLEDMDTFS
jgi:hypothetical protein